MPARLLSCAVVALAFLHFEREVCRSDETAPYRLEGTVTDESGQPVADVAVNVLIESERDSQNRIRTVKTDATGHYSISVPVGHATIFGLAPAPGYSSVNTFDREDFATTRGEPVARKDFRVRPGVAWPVVVRTDQPLMPLPKLWVSGWQQRDKEFFSAFIELDGVDRGVLTLPDVGGPFTLTCRDREEMLIAPAEMKLTFDKGFRTDRVASVKAHDNGGAELRDEQGLTATVVGFTPEVSDRKPLLVIPMKAQPVSVRAAITGRIVAAGKKPVVGARVELVRHSGGGSAATDIVANTDADGKFR